MALKLGGGTLGTEEEMEVVGELFLEKEDEHL